MSVQGSSVIVDLERTIADLAPRVLRYANARLGDPALAEDVAQESSGGARSGLQERRAPDSAEAFVFAIARRRAGRAAWRRRLWAPLELASGARSSAPSPEARAIGHDEAARVRSAVAQLAPRDREAILLVAVGGLSMAEAAEALGLSLSAVKMRVSRARARLAALIEARHG